MFQRILGKAIKAAQRQFPVVVLTGARQVGKTTLAQFLLPKANYVTLDSIAEAETARLNPAEFFRRHPCPLVVDEVQYAPSLFRHLKILVDGDRTPGRFLLTGSQTFELMEGVSESLAGRCAVMTLPPLSVPELARIKSLGELDGFLWRGGFPELWRTPDLNRELWLSSYVTTYLERDVRNLLNVGSLRDFDRFLRATALRAGQLLSYADLARDVGITPHTAKSWVSVLEASHQIFLLEPYHRQRTKRLVKSPKLYFSDTGLLCHLMGFSRSEELSRHALWGSIWENFVVSEIRKHFQVHGIRPPLWLWRTSAGDEVDVLIETAPEKFITVECKAAEAVDRSALKSLEVLAANYGAESIVRSFVACRTDKPYPLAAGSQSEAIPLAGEDGLLARLSMEMALPPHSR